MDLFDAIEKNDIGEVNRMIRDGADINARDSFGYSALHFASSQLHEVIALSLIEAGIDTNSQDKNGLTVLHYAAVYNQLGIAIAALKRGASLLIENTHGNQPLWDAVFNDKGRNERIEIIKLYLEHGADPTHKNNVGKSPLDIIKIGGYNNLKELFGLS